MINETKVQDDGKCERHKRFTLIWYIYRATLMKSKFIITITVSVNFLYSFLLYLESREEYEISKSGTAEGRDCRQYL